MYEDAIKTSGRSGQIELRELAELVFEALDLEPTSLHAGVADEARVGESEAGM
jgi:hypothetical protein